MQKYLLFRLGSAASSISLGFGWYSDLVHKNEQMLVLIAGGGICEERYMQSTPQAALHTVLCSSRPRHVSPVPNSSLHFDLPRFIVFRSDSHVVRQNLIILVERKL